MFRALFLPNSVWRGLSRSPMRLSSSISNIPPGLRSKIGTNLHLQQHHPLSIIRNKIYRFFDEGYIDSFGEKVHFQKFDTLSPLVSTHQNFDSLLVPKDHVCRAPSDTYYEDHETVLRTHTSAHQTTLLKEGETSFLVVGDCYRRDAIDQTHFPIFHQMEGVRVFDRSEVSEQEVIMDMKHVLTNLITHLMGDSVQVRWIDEYFPFTDPSFEMEIYFRDDWVEVLGCGLIHRVLLDNIQKTDKIGWAFGQGLERLAMILFKIPDIRLFWSTDPRFVRQFDQSYVELSSDQIPLFQSYSKFPACYKDVSFWVPEEGFHEHDFFELVREVAGETVEDVVLVSSFTHPKTNKLSHCYRINYRCMDRNLTNEEVDKIQHKMRRLLEEELRVELR